MDLLVLNTHEKDWKVGKEIRLLSGKLGGRLLGGFEKGRAKNELL